VIDQTSAVLLGLGWLALFVFAEGYYRAGALEGFGETFRQGYRANLVVRFCCRSDPFLPARHWRRRLVALADSLG
jgi:hypothetical protein